MPRNKFEDSRISEGTREEGDKSKSAPRHESSSISRDDVRDGVTEGGDSINQWEHNTTDSADGSRS